MSYSNPGNAIAGYLIEKSRKAVRSIHTRQFSATLGMEEADYPFTDANKPLLAAAYHGNPPKAVGYPFIYLRPAGDLKASPGELAKLVQFLCGVEKQRKGNWLNPSPSSEWKRRKPRWPQKTACGLGTASATIRA